MPPDALTDDATLFDALPWGVLVLDSQGIIRRVNEQAATWCATPASALRCQPLASAPLPPALACALRQLLETPDAAPPDIWLPHARQWVSLRLGPAPAGQHWVFWEDATARHQAETTQERSSQLLLDMEAVAHIGSYEADLATGTFYFSDGMYRLFGEEPQHFALTLAVIDARSHPDDVAAVQQVLAEAIRTRQPYTYRLRIRRADGQWRTLEAHGEVRTDAAGHTVQLRGLVQDVTERVQAEQQLLQSQELLRRTIDSSLDMVQVFEAVRDEQGAVVDFAWVLNNAAAERQYGDVIGQRLLQLNPGVVEEGIFDTFRQVLETGVPDQRERHYVHEQFDGWFYQSTVRVGDGVTTTTHDITERKQAEQALRASQQLVQTVFDVLLNPIAYHKAVRDAAGSIVDFEFQLENREARKYAVADRCGQRFSEAYPSILETDVFRLYCEVVETGQPLNAEVEMKLKGQNRWFHLMAAKLDDGLVATAVDVTERRQAEVEILRLKEEIAQQATDRYHALFYSMDEGFCVLDVLFDEAGQQAVDFRYQELNPVFAQQSGLPEGAQGRTARELLPELEPFWLALYGRVALTGEPQRVEHYVPPVGRWFDVHAFRVGPPAARQVAVLFSDITARKQAEQQQAFLLQLSDALRPLAAPATVAEQACRLVVEQLGASRAQYTLVAGEPGEEMGAVCGEYLRHGQPMPHRYPYAGFGENLVALLRAGQTLVLTDTDHDPRLTPEQRAQYAAVESPAAISVPLVKDGRIIANFTVHDRAPRPWTAANVALLEAVAERTWAAVERARAEEALRASEAQFRAVANLVPDLLWRSTPDSDTTWYNQQWYEYTGQTPAEAAGYGWTDATHPNDRAKSSCRYRAAMATGQPLHQEHRIRSARGEYRWFQVQARPVRNAQGEAIAWFGAATDIHARKRREANLAFLAEISQELAQLTSVDATMRRLGARLGEYFQLSHCRFVELDEAQEFVVVHHCWERADVPAIPSRAHRIGDFLTPEFARRSRAGETFVIRDTAHDPLADAARFAALGIGAFVAVPFVRDGEWQFWLGLYRSEAYDWGADELDLLREIADRIWLRLEQAQAEEALQRSEQRLRALIANLPGAAAFVVGPDLRYQLAGGEALEAAGLTPADLLGRTMAEALPPELVALHETYYRQALAGQGFAVEHAAYGRTFLSRGVPLLGPAGQPEAVLVVSFDITERQQAEEALRASEGRLAVLNTELEQRVAARTHELRESRDLLQTVFDTSLIAMSVQEAVRNETGAIQDFRLRLVSRELARETGRSDLVGKLYAQEYPGIRDVGLFDLAVRAVETGQPQGMEYYYPHEGFYKWFACQFVQLGDGVVATNLDITERKVAEQELRKSLRLLEEAEAVAGLGSWDYELATNTLRWSNGMYQLFGRPVGSPVAPSYYLDAVLPDDQARAEQLVRQLTAGEGVEQTLRLRVGEQVKTVRLKAVVLPGEDGRPARVLGVDVDISELQRLEADNLRLRLTQQRALFEAVQAAQEAERKRMAESLHNGIGQILYATKLRLDQLHAPLLGTAPRLAAARREADQLLGEAIRQTRALSHELVPMVLEEFGLAAALQDIARKMSTPQLVLYSHVVFDDAAAPLSPALQMALYRMAQELAQNIVKHARGATTASLELETTPGWVLLRAHDNGPGLAATPPQRTGLGLRSIRDRVALLGGQLETGALATGGAYVRIRVPLPPTPLSNLSSTQSLSR